MRWITILLSLSACIGCATSRLDYAPPSATQPAPNSIVVNAPFETVWRSAIAGLAQRFFVINNTDANSGLINVSFSGTPKEYCDCGEFTIFHSYTEKPQATYQGASRVERHNYFLPNGALVTRDRSVSLDGRVNIVLEPLTASQTRATVNCRYIVEEIEQMDAAGGYRQRKSSAAFNTNTDGQTPYGMICRPTGKLEREILDVIAQMPTN